MAKKKPKRDPAGWTKASAFRLSEETLTGLDQIAAGLSQETGITHNRTDVIRRFAKMSPAALSSAGLPHYGSIPCGKPVSLVEPTAERLDLAAIFAAPGLYILTARGASMEAKGILDGDYLVIRKAETADEGQVVVAWVDGAVTLKTLVCRGRGHLREVWLHPACKDDQHQPIFLAPDGDNRILGVLVGVIRRV